MNDELTLFGPEDCSRPAPPVPDAALGAIGTKWTRIKSASRSPMCTDCITLVHEQGVDVAPHPSKAINQRVGPLGTTYHCPPHSEERKRLDARAEGLSGARKEINARAKKPRAYREHA